MAHPLMNLSSDTFGPDPSRWIGTFDVGISVADPGCLFQIQGPNFAPPGSEFFPSRILDHHQKNLCILTQKVVSKLWDVVRSGLFIPDPDSDFFTHPGSPKKAPDSGSATLVVI